MFDERLKQAKLAKNKDFGTAERHAIKNEEKQKLKTFDLSYFLVKVILKKIQRSII